MTFKEEFWQEWARLNPRFSTDNDSVVEIFQHAARETWHGYFAPLRIAVWLFKAALKKVF